MSNTQTTQRRSVKRRIQVSDRPRAIRMRLGNRINNIEKAKYLLNLNGINVVKSSSYYETLSWPDPSKPKFLNIIKLHSI